MQQYSIPYPGPNVESQVEMPNGPIFDSELDLTRKPLKPPRNTSPTHSGKKCQSSRKDDETLRTILSTETRDDLTRIHSAQYLYNP